MKVFISWSGATSRRVAELLRDWIPDVIQTIELFLTIRDIEKGTRWFSEISTQLEESNHGIICVTPDNKDRPWIHFEAGALAKNVGKSRVYPLLINLKPSDLEGPFVQLQVTIDTKDDFLRLFRCLNRESNKPLSEERLEKYFNRTWDEFETKLEEVKKDTPEIKEPVRSEEDKLDELLESVRGLIRESSSSRINQEKIDFRHLSSLISEDDEDYEEQKSKLEIELFDYSLESDRTIIWKVQKSAIYLDRNTPISDNQVKNILEIGRKYGFTIGSYIA